jgi:hypothetical protein
MIKKTERKIAGVLNKKIKPGFSGLYFLLLTGLGKIQINNGDIVANISGGKWVFF